MIDNFNVKRQGPGHWDVSSNGKLVFVIRGDPGAWSLNDERDGGGDLGFCGLFGRFSQVTAYICEAIMSETATMDIPNLPFDKCIYESPISGDAVG